MDALTPLQCLFNNHTLKILFRILFLRISPDLAEAWDLLAVKEMETEILALPGFTMHVTWAKLMTLATSSCVKGPHFFSFTHKEEVVRVMSLEGGNSSSHMLGVVE